MILSPDADFENNRLALDESSFLLHCLNALSFRCLIECRDELRYSIDAVDCLIRNQLVVVQQYDLHLAQLVENNVSQMLVAFVMQLIQRFCLDTDRSGQGVQEVGISHNQSNCYSWIVRTMKLTGVVVEVFRNFCIVFTGPISPLMCRHIRGTKN